MIRPPTTTATTTTMDTFVEATSAGIDQWRTSADLGPAWADPMNLDDFNLPSSVVSPSTTTSPTASASTVDQDVITSAHAVAAAIPIKSKRDRLPRLVPDRSPASAPIPPQIREPAGEFAYVQRRLRKTSIDERRVSPRSFLARPYFPPRRLTPHLSLVLASQTTSRLLPASARGRMSDGPHRHPCFHSS